MALSLDSIFQPFNDFFMKKYGTQDGQPVLFRFARVPQTFGDDDFLLTSSPESGPNPDLAQQLFSEAVDGIATLEADGRNVSIGDASFSDLYELEIVGPSIPFVPATVTNETEREAMRDSFTSVRNTAVARLHEVRHASLEAGESATNYHPSTPHPTNWWDPKAPAGVWTPQSFQIVSAAPTPNQPVQPNDRLFRMRIDDVKFNAMLTARVAVAPPAKKAMVMSRSTASLARSPQMTMARPMAATSVIAREDFRASDTAVLARKPIAERPEIDAEIKPNYKRQIAMLPYKQRVAFRNEVAQDAPTRPVASAEVNISFDFCLVKVERPWLIDAFVNNSYWYIPGKSKGALSANDSHGAPAYPVSFVAIKNLRIKAPWTPEDISNLALSYQFGPFNFSSTVVDGALCHDDIQVAAWILQQTPALPPNATT